MRSRCLLKRGEGLLCSQSSTRDSLIQLFSTRGPLAHPPHPVLPHPPASVAPAHEAGAAGRSPPPCSHDAPSYMSSLPLGHVPAESAVACTHAPARRVGVARAPAARRRARRSARTRAARRSWPPPPPPPRRRRHPRRRRRRAVEQLAVGAVAEAARARSPACVRRRLAPAAARRHQAALLRVVARRRRRHRPLEEQRARQPRRRVRRQVGVDRRAVERPVRARRRLEHQQRLAADVHEPPVPQHGVRLPVADPRRLALSSAGSVRRKRARYLVDGTAASSSPMSMYVSTASRSRRPSPRRAERPRGAAHPRRRRGA